MSLVKFIGLLAGVLFTFCHAQARQKGNFLFDMGTSASRLEAGYMRVTPGTMYSEKRGYGWIKAPAGAFDTTYNRVPFSLLQDGVVAKGSLEFKVKIPPGDYFISITVGHPDVDPMLMEISVDGSVLAKLTVPWYRLPYRSVRRKLTIGGEGAVVSLKGLGSAQLAGIYSLEFRPVSDFHITGFSNGPEADTAALKSLVLSLKNDRPASVSLTNRLDIVQKHLAAARFFELAGWSASARKTRMNQIQRMYAAIDLLDQVVADKSYPLYPQSLYLLAKIHYWLDKEDNELLTESSAKSYFDELARLFPDHQLIKMYRGDPVPDPYVANVEMTGAPQWAVFQREAMDRMQKVIHWWVNERQAPNGELGGKYADDVEMLRWWLPAIVGADDETARKGYARLADGIWNSGELVNGYDKKVDDVEHAAELFRDSHAGMFLVRYGDPAYVERAMISMQNFEKVWSGKTHLGHRHFKSYYFSATETLHERPYGVDVPLNARALLTGLWAAWYNRNPELIRLFSEWVNAWVDDAQRTDNGKPAGIIPPAVSFQNEHLGGFSDQWYDPALRYSYYQWDHLGHIAELYSFINGMYGLTGNKALLRPINKVAEMMTRQSTGVQTAEPGSELWVEKILKAGGEDRTAGANPFGNLFAMTARLTGDRRYDPLIKQFASPYNKYQLTGDLKEMLYGFDQILQSLRYNFPLMTSEVKFTDRVYVRGSDLLTGMYTGHFGRGFEFPALVATWRNTGKDVSVFVRRGDRLSAVVSLFNAGAEKQIEMNTWMLAPGVYKLTVGADKNDDTVAEHILHQEQVTIKERVGTIKIYLPAKTEVVVKMDQERSFAAVNHDASDLALSPEDITVLENKGKLQVQVTLHNIGNVASKAALAYLYVNGSVRDSVVVNPIEAPNDLQPRTDVILFGFISKRGPNEIMVSVKNDDQELNSSNNMASISYVFADRTKRK